TRGAEAIERLSKLLLRPRLARAVTTEARRHDAQVDVTKRRLLIDDGLRRRTDARHHVVFPPAQPQEDARPIAFGSVDPVDDFIQNLTLFPPSSCPPRPP